MAALFALGLMASACSSPPEPPPIATPATSPTTSAAGRTETEWGTIWDALPAGFPSYPGSRPTDVGEGPASAVLDVPAEVPAVASWFEAALERLGFRSSVSGPAEDGSMQIDSDGPMANCAVRTTVAPLGGTTIVTILYGAGCPPH